MTRTAVSPSPAPSRTRRRRLKIHTPESPLRYGLIVGDVALPKLELDDEKQVGNADFERTNLNIV